MGQGVLIALAFATGVLVPLQLAFNGQLGVAAKSPYWAALIVFLIGAAILGVLVTVSRIAPPPLDALGAAPPTVWLGGVIATCYIVAVVFLTPRLGVGMTTVLILTGQIVTAVVLDHFGAFGTTAVAFGPQRAFGVALLVGGVVAIRGF